MTEQTKAQRLAAKIDPYGEDEAEAAAELRRLDQSEREGWRYADELEQERKRLAALNAELVEALEKLARLGNGDQYGNSIGNDIAKAALAKAKEQT